MTDHPHLTDAERELLRLEQAASSGGLREHCEFSAAARVHLRDVLLALDASRAENAHIKQWLADNHVSECLIPADEDGPNRLGYMLGKDDGKSLLYPTEKEAVAQGLAVGRLERELAASRAECERLRKACQSYIDLFRDSDMSPEDECHELYAAMHVALTTPPAEQARPQTRYKCDCCGKRRVASKVFGAWLNNGLQIDPDPATCEGHVCKPCLNWPAVKRALLKKWRKNND